MDQLAYEETQATLPNITFIEGLPDDLESRIDCGSPLSIVQYEKELELRRRGHAARNRTRNRKVKMRKNP
jgi:hypothetical protein